MSSERDSANPRIHIYGHVSSQPKALAELFGAVHSNEAIAESELAIFAINPAAGIDQETIDLWSALTDFQLPRLVVVNELEGSDSDFDDAVLLANRVFDPLVTPYLVLHDDAGNPSALIDLETLEIIDYSQSPTSRRDSDPEHKVLVFEFRKEYLEAIEEFGESGFQDGLSFPAIPFIPENGLGSFEIASLLNNLPSRG